MFFTNEKLAVGFLLLNLAPLWAGQAQAPGETNRVITLTSIPSGASVWLKDGRNFVCTGKVTPTAVKIPFLGPDDFRKIMLRKPGFESTFSILTFSDQTRESTLQHQVLVPPDPPEANEAENMARALLRREVVHWIEQEGDAFRCGAFELLLLNISGSAGHYRLSVIVGLDGNFGGSAFQAAKRIRDARERGDGIALRILEIGGLRLLESLRRLATRLPGLDNLTSNFLFTSNQAVLDTRPEYFTYTWRSEYYVSIVQSRQDRTIVVDQKKQNMIQLSLPWGKLPSGTVNESDAKRVLELSTVTLFDGTN